jgi:hypothetical protein
MESWSEWRSRVRRVAEELAPLLQEALDEGQLETAEAVLNETLTENDVNARAILLREDDEV